MKFKRRSVVLLIVLLVVGMVVYFVFDGSYQIKLFLDQFTLWKNHQELKLKGNSLIKLAVAFIKQESKKEGKLSLEKLEEKLLGISFLSKNFVADKLLLKVEGEEGKLNLNALIYKDGQENVWLIGVMKRLLKKLGIQEKNLYLLLDWIDKDSEQRTTNSEKNFKNDYFDSYSEIYSIPGIDPHFGDAIKPYVTIFGDGKIDINMVKPLLLESLDESLSDSNVQEFLEKRKEAAFDEVGKFLKISAFSRIGLKFIDHLKLSSTYYKIEVILENDIWKEHIECVVDFSTADSKVKCYLEY